VIVTALTSDRGHTSSNPASLRSYRRLPLIPGETFLDGCYKKFVLD
jgi:hypothetical protein